MFFSPLKKIRQPNDSDFGMETSFFNSNSSIAFVRICCVTFSGSPAFVIWKNKLGKYIIQYQGAIDDNAGEPEKVTQHFLTNAMDELLLKKEVSTPKSESFGCRIFFRGEKNKMD